MKTSKPKRPNSIFSRWLSSHLQVDDLMGDFAEDAFRDHRIWAINDVETMRTFISRNLPQESAISVRRIFNNAVFRGELGEPLNGPGAKRNRSSSSFRQMRLPISPTLRFQVLQDCDYRCQLCGAKATDGEDVRLEVDHKTPVKKGGTNDRNNLWLLCFTCNRGKSDKDL